MIAIAWGRFTPSTLTALCVRHLHPEAIMQTFIAPFGSLLSGIGLIVSGMAEPSRVIGFLDVALRRA